MNADTVRNLYFNWMASLAIPDAFRRDRYMHLLVSLDSTIFYFTISLDENRYTDGIDLRYRFGLEKDIPQNLVSASLGNRQCSMLEMMVALALRCEEHIIDDPQQLSNLFFDMLSSLKLLKMTNDHFDEAYVNYRLDCLLNHEYEPNGSGGLFTINNPREDMRNVEIWYQMCWYVDIILKEA